MTSNKSIYRHLAEFIIVVIFLIFYFASQMQIRLLFVSRKTTIDDFKRAFMKYDITKVCNCSYSFEEIENVERIYGRIKVINHDSTIAEIYRATKKTSSFFKRPEKCFFFFDANGRVVGYHYEIED